MDGLNRLLFETDRKKRSLLRIGQRQFENLGAQRGLRDFDIHVTCSRQRRQRETSGNLPNVHV